MTYHTIDLGVTFKVVIKNFDVVKQNFIIKVVIDVSEEFV